MKSAQHAARSRHEMNIQGPPDSHPPGAGAASLPLWHVLTFENTKKIPWNMSSIFPFFKKKKITVLNSFKNHYCDSPKTEYKWTMS